MTFINRLSNSVPITAPEAQSETVSQPEAQTNFGIANTADLFEANVSNNFGLVQQPENFSLMQPVTTNDTAVDASSLFSDMAEIVAQPKDRLTELSERLDLVKQKRNELSTQIQDTNEKQRELEKAVKAVDESLKNDMPLPEEVATALEGLGVAGVIGGILAGVPVLSAFGAILGGLSAGYKEKLKQAKNELERKKVEMQENAEEFKSQLEDVNKDEYSLVELIEEEKRRQQLGLEEQRLNSNLMTAEAPWQEFIPPESVIQKNDPPGAEQFDPHIQKFTKEE